MSEGSAPTKACGRCRADKAVSEFSLRARCRDGRQSECKSCMSARYQADKAGIRERQRKTWASYSSENGDALRERNRQYRAETRQQAAAYRAEYKATCAPKIAAKNAIRLAILTGKLRQQPCEVCGATVADAHHDDYSAPLEIRWLCRRHHTAWHAEHGEAPNGRAIEAAHGIAASPLPPQEEAP